jgi:hypothetical protein
LWELQSHTCGSSSHLCLHSRKDRIPSPQGKRYPPSKCRLICYAQRLSKLSQLNWTGVLEPCKLTQDSVPSFQYTSKLQPWVVFLYLLWPDLIVGYLSLIGTAMAHPFVGFGGLMDLPCLLSINSSKTMLCLVTVSIIGFLGVELALRMLWWIDGCTMSPLNQFIKGYALVDLHFAVDL